MLHSDESLVVQIGKLGIIGTVNVVHPLAIDHRVGDKIAVFRVVAHRVAHRNLTVLGIGTVINDFGLRAHGTVFAVLIHRAGVGCGQGEHPLNPATVSALPTDAIDADGKVVTLVVEFVLVIQAAIGEKVAVRDAAAFRKGSNDRIGQKLFPELVSPVDIIPPIGPRTEPDVYAIGSIYLIIKAKMATCTEILFVVARRVNLMVSESIVDEKGLFHAVVALPNGIAAVNVGIDRQFLVRPNIRQPGANVRARRSVHAKAEELVFLDFGIGHDVDDAIGLGAVACRGIGNNFHSINAIGWHGLDVGFEVLGGHVRGFVVDPHLHARCAAQADVALHVHFHARRVLQGIRGRSRLDTGVFGHVVHGLLPFHGKQGTLLRDDHLIKFGGAFREFQLPQILVAFHGQHLLKGLETNG